MLHRWLRRETPPAASETGAEPPPDGAPTDAASPDGPPLDGAPSDAAPPNAPAPNAPSEQIERSLARTRRGLLGRLSAVFTASDIGDDTWEELETQLILSDVGASVAADLVARTRREARARGVRRASDLPDVLSDVVVDVLRGALPDEAPADARALPSRGTARGESTAGPSSGTARREPTAGPSSGAARGEPVPRPWITLVVGVNGSGKTTTIAKLAALHRRAGQAVLLVAADTFRAAAVEQLVIWGERVGADVIAGQQGGDPGAVVFDALSSTEGRSADVVIVDTAGRLHTQHNLMAELVKVRNVARRVVPDAPHETLLVLDATTGQNGLAQARAFTEAVDVSGIVLAKLDSSARGGVALAVTRELGLPILYVGTGEQVDDLSPFDAVAYAEGLLGRDRVGGASAELGG